MVNIYDEYLDDDSNVITDRTKLFVPASEIKEDGSFTHFQSGILVTPDKSGFFYIVDNWIIEQIEKIIIVDGRLAVKENEELIPPVKSEKELQREALLKQLAELDADE